jgi:excisionase family DNA binding protein
MVSEEPISAKEAARMLGVTPRTVIRLADKGEIKAFRVGELWKFYASDIREFIEQQRQSRTYRQEDN